MNADRLMFWSRKLRPILVGLDSDPVERQLRRKLRATAVLSGVFGVVSLIFMGIFTGFGRGDVGLWLVGVLIGLPLGWSWLDHALLRRRVGKYLRERQREEPTG